MTDNRPLFLIMGNGCKLQLKGTFNTTDCRLKMHSISVVMTFVVLQQGISGLLSQNTGSLWITTYQVLLQIYSFNDKR